MRTAIVIPARPADPWRAAALTYVEAWYARHLPDAELLVGGDVEGEWSKGAAVRSLVDRTEARVLVIADADSFVTDVADLNAALDMVRHGARHAVTPHRRVYRLSERETARLEADPTLAPRLGHTVRPVYNGPIGGGITVVDRWAFDAVGGIDPRFLGWGGEDVAFGWALETLCAPVEQMDAVLVHLWHPHPAPKLRGSPESEALVAKYQAARLIPRRMAHVVRHEDPPPAEPLEAPVVFRMKGGRTSLRMPNGDVVRFTGGSARYGGTYATADPDVVTMLRTFRIVTEEKPKT